MGNIGARCETKPKLLVQGIQKIKELLQNGGNANAQSGRALYPLEAAASHGQTSATRILLGNGANVNRGNEIQGTPLFFVISSGNADLVELLLSRGVRVYPHDNASNPLKMARAMKNDEIISILERFGAK